MHPDNIDLILEELGRLREEVVNTRNVSIKADNLIKNLATEVKSITDKQRRQERRSLFNSGVAYLIFVMLIGGGAYFTFESRLDRERSDKALFADKEAGYKKEITELNAELGRWRQIERELLEFERMVRTGKKEQAVAKFSALKRVRFSGLLEHLINRFRAEVALEKFESGVAHFRKGNFTRADAALTRSSEYDVEPPYLGQLLYYQGMSALRLKDFPRASDLLRKSLEHKQERRMMADARYHLAYAFDRMGESRTARDLYYRFFKRHEKHPWAARAKRRYQQLKNR
jgi:tetratricopeptide (TPR) repeat protein